MPPKFDDSLIGPIGNNVPGVWDILRRAVSGNAPGQQNSLPPSVAFARPGVVPTILPSPTTAATSFGPAPVSFGPAPTSFNGSMLAGVPSPAFKPPTPLTVAPITPAVPTATPTTPAATGLLSRLGLSKPSLPAGASGLKKWGPSLMKGLPWALGGIIAPQIIKGIYDDPNSGVDDALAQAAQWGAMGGGIGAMFGGWGAPIGAGAGALLGGISGYFGGKDKGPKAAKKEATKQRETLMTLLGTSFTPEIRTQLSQSFDALTSQAQTPDQVRMVASQITQSIPEISNQLRAAEFEKSRALAIQGAMQEYMAPYLAQIQATNEMMYSNDLSRAERIPGYLSKEYTKTAAKDKLATEKYIAQLATQIAQRPQDNIYNMGLNLVGQLQNALVGQTVSNYVNPPQTADLTAILQQAGVAG